MKSIVRKPFAGFFRFGTHRKKIIALFWTCKRTHPQAMAGSLVPEL
jgi:hypothetical protein